MNNLLTELTAKELVEVKFALELRAESLERKIAEGDGEYDQELKALNKAVWILNRA